MPVAGLVEIEKSCVDFLQALAGDPGAVQGQMTGAGGNEWAFMLACFFLGRSTDSVNC